MIIHEANGSQIGQRREDGYINLSSMAQANSKLIADYLRLEVTKAFLEELSADMGIPISGKSGLIQIRKGGNNKAAQGTWGHPLVAINCGQWCSPKFAVLVSKWVLSWIKTGNNPIYSDIEPNLWDFVSELEQQMIAIRSQARLIHTSTHQPVNEILHQSLHTVIHKQIGLINSVIQQILMLKELSSSGAKDSEVDSSGSTTEVKEFCETVRNTIRIELTVDESLRQLCHEERITKETWLEAAYLYLEDRPEELAEVVRLAQERLSQRKAIADYKRAKTMQQRFLES
ncbi:KilA domain protein (plasmid) [Gloeothece citriformis PCC 7424]|uniref:KilA domain protein n=1 Tax=Gloeothece citriformis (strain PCC 7424) TaxID=65393 RepID=B7KMS6_GLOC7|nr:KilA-N domain-containing protein [Gloeothece citriformis]ACK74098.1 KilA domain protein [Gloeothece citriformis PCC 7424]